MPDQYTADILERLKNYIKSAEVKGIPLNRITMGIDIYSLLSISERLQIDRGGERKLFGIALSVDYGRPMALEVCYVLPVELPERSGAE